MNKTDIEIILDALHDLAHSSDRNAHRARELFSTLTTAEQNAARERVTAEFRRDGSLVLLTR